MAQSMAHYGTEAKCRKALFRSRWPKGYRCPACAGRMSSRFRREGQIYYQCRACRHQTTLLSGTLFEATKLPLTTWFLAIHMLTSTKSNMAALELKRHLGVTYRTAWRLKHKVTEAMMQREKRFSTAKPVNRASSAGSCRSTMRIWVESSTVANRGVARRTSRHS
jgi:ribosomal protein L37AE/L43A